VHVKRSVPNFLFLGPDKAGSSWIHRALAAHPEVFMTPAKDPWFFDENYHRGWDWYLGNFEGHGDARIVGEASHNYLFSDVAAERIARDLEDPFLSVCLREPAERAFSAYLFLLRQGIVRGSFEDALTEIPALVDNGRYYTHLRRYLDRFPRERIHVAVFDELERSPQQFYDGFTDHLRIGRQALDESLAGKALPASRARSHALTRVVRAGAKAFRRVGLVKPVGVIKNNPLVQRLLFEPYAESNRPRPDPGTLRRLRDRFHPELEALDRELGLGLTARWLGERRE
jgi:hypothetical protein